MTVCVIPAHRAAETIVDVVRSVLPFVDRVIVVEDACSQECGLIVQSTFAGDARVEVLRHQVNRGVGGAMKTGFRRALQLKARFVVKVDADGQMDPANIPQMVAVLQANPRISLVKGNRFCDGSIARIMPGARLLGNSMLTLLVRATTGYWNGSDPTNGFFAISGQALARLKLDRLADRFYFEISLLVALGLRRAEIAEIDIPALYGAERSNLSIWKVALTFPPMLLASFLRRLVWQYIVSDMNVGSLLMFVGLGLMSIGSGLGLFWWAQALRTGVAQTSGAALLVMLPLIMGFQMLLSAVLYDVQNSSRVYKFPSERSESRVGDERVSRVLA